jgi:hypothetical protein
MTLPNWLIQLGSLAGLGTLALTIIGWLFSERPVLSIRPGTGARRTVYCFNPSKHDILIRKISVWPRGVLVASGTSVNEIARAAANQTFAAFLKQGESLDLPLMFRNGELVDDGSRALAPFLICMSWRRAHAVWLPQIPVIKFSSARSVRRLIDIKTAPQPKR